MRSTVVSKLERRLKRDVATIQLRDQTLFTLGIFWVVVGTFWFTKYPTTFPLAHFIGFPFIFGWLVFSYALRPHRKWGFFLIDFCYFANAATWVLTFTRLVKFPSSKARHLSPLEDHLFVVIFCLNMGPLLMANLPWRVSLVFHSPDKMSSEFIHTVAPLCCFAHRWWGLGEPQKSGILLALLRWEGGAVGSALQLLLRPFLAYLLWQALYVFVTECICRGVMDDPRFDTSLRHQASSFNKAATKGKGGLLHSVAQWCGVLKEGQLDPCTLRAKVFFMGAQALYTLLTLLVAALAWHSFFLNTVLIVGVLFHTVFQGAGFYVRVFSERYIDEAKASVVEGEYGKHSQRSSSTPLVRGGAGALPEGKVE
jgi:hypothetical protein